MNANYLAAAKKAEHLRIKMSLTSLQPVNIFDICEVLDVTVRFVEVDMEGMYFSTESGISPTIVLSNRRPMQRRVFTCAHELGHHLFGHGSKVDSVSEDPGSEAHYNDEERLVDTFAGVLLMPVAGVQKEFKTRGWSPGTASEMEFYVIACLFGVGFRTLVTHCKVHSLISADRANLLAKTIPAKLFRKFCNEDLSPAPFKVIDGLSKLNTSDVEVNSYILVPVDSVVEGDHIVAVGYGPGGKIFKALRPGIVRVYSALKDFGCFVRVQKMNYVGLAEYRHLEDEDI